MLEVGPNGLPLLRQMGLVNRIPLPPELVEHFGRKLSNLFLLYRVILIYISPLCLFVDMLSYCRMGLFPFIQRAWLSIDSDIYVWTYEDGYVETNFLHDIYFINHYMLKEVSCHILMA